MFSSIFDDQILALPCRPAVKMLSRSLKRALLDSRWPVPPTFLLPWAANLTTVSHSMDTNAVPLPPAASQPSSDAQRSELRPSSRQTPRSNAAETMQFSPPTPPPTSSAAKPLDLSPSLREMLPLLKAQAPHYITVHIHGKPYLLTQGDTLRLPFLMHGVEPGDVLRLNRAINIGSRDYTLKAAAAAPPLKSPTTDTRNIREPWATQSEIMPLPPLPAEPEQTLGSATVQHAPHFIPHIAKGKHSYIDDRLFECRATVMAVESEPLRIKEKTKRRQRRVKKVKSKHRFTILRVKELKVRGVEELEGAEES